MSTYTYVAEVDETRGVITLAEADACNFKVGMALEITGAPPWHFRFRSWLVRGFARLLRVPVFTLSVLLLVGCYGGEYDVTKRPCEHPNHAQCNVPNDAGIIYAVCASDDVCHFLCDTEADCPETQICHFDPWSLLNVCWDD